MKKKIAFFIDDDADFLRAVKDLVDHPDYEIQTHCATNGYRIVDEILQKKPDIVFIDFNLPRANGAQVVGILRSISDYQQIPIYFVTGYPKETVASFLDNIHCSGVLDKTEHFFEKVPGILDSAA